MGFKLWDSPSIDEHLINISKMLKDRRRAGYLAQLPNRQSAGFAELSIRACENGCTGQLDPFLKGFGLMPNTGASASAGL